MVAKKPRIVIIGAGMAGLTAANKLYTAPGSKDLFDLCVVEGGNKIGGRINTSEFGGAKIELGATWIHGVQGSPVHKISQQTGSLNSDQPWECMDGSPDKILTVAEGGLELKPSIVDPINALFHNLMHIAKEKQLEPGPAGSTGSPGLSIGSFLRLGLRSYWDSLQEHNPDLKSLEEAVFSIQENIQRTYTSAGDLRSLDYEAESEYKMFPGEEITIAKGYITVIDSLASVLPRGMIQLGRKVVKIEWQIEGFSRPVKIYFSDESVLSADHVIVTVSLGVLKSAIREEVNLFSPPLPYFKIEAISRLGYGVVDKLFVEMPETSQRSSFNFPYLLMAFHKPNSELRDANIPWWMRRTASIFPIYQNSRVLLSWFAGKEAMALESLTDDDILDGVLTTISSFFPSSGKPFWSRVLKSKWGTDPLFLGSYSYVVVGSTGEDFDRLAEPLPRSPSSPALQILFAGEATHRTHYSTTHGAYFSGVREASRLLKFYNSTGVSGLFHT